MKEALRREMVPVEGPRATRFRYPGEVSGPADEEICSEGGNGWWWRGSRGCYRGLPRSIPFTPCAILHMLRVKVLHGDGYSLGGLGQKAYQILAAHGRLETGGGTGSAGCHSLCSVGARQE